MKVGNLERAMRIFAYYSEHADVEGEVRESLGRRLIVRGIHLSMLHPADVKRLEERGFTWKPEFGGYWESKEGW